MAKKNAESSEQTATEPTAPMVMCEPFIVLTPTIVSPLGYLHVGHEIIESDVSAETWEWLKAGGHIKPKCWLEAEADKQPVSES